MKALPRRFRFRANFRGYTVLGAMTLLDPDVYLNNSGLLMYGLQESLVVKYVGMEPESIVGVMGGARVYPSLVIIEPSLSP